MAAVVTFARRIPRRSFAALASGDNVSKLGANDVALKMVAAPITGADTMSGAGVVTSVGSSVKNLSIDDVVFSKANLGAYRPVVKADAKNLVKVSSSIPAEYASIIDAPCTAAELLKNVKAGDVVVQSGADSLVGQSVVQLARAKGITTINIVKPSTDESEMVALLQSLGGDVVCQPQFAVSHKFRELISDLGKPVLSIHYADNLDDSKSIKSITGKGSMKTLRGVVEGASNSDLLKLKVASVLNRLSSNTVAYGPNVDGIANAFNTEKWFTSPEAQKTVSEVCDKIEKRELHMWVENFPVEDLDYASTKAAGIEPGFRANILKF